MRKLFIFWAAAWMAANMMAQDVIGMQDEMAEKPVEDFYPLVCDGNTYYYNGQAMAQKEMLEWYARQNCQAAYDHFRSARKMATAGWVFLGIGVAMEIGGGVCAATYIWQRYYDSSSSASQLPTWQRNPNYKPLTPLQSAAIGLTVGAVLFEAASIPLLVVGYHKMHSSVDVYNVECSAAQEQAYWTLQTSDNGLGIALNF